MNKNDQSLANIYFGLADGRDIFDVDEAAISAPLDQLPKLESPRIVRESFDRVSTYEAMSAPDELLTHYRGIISLACKYGVSFDQYSHQFQLSLEIGSTAANNVITFDWYDTLVEIDQFIDWIRKGANYEYTDIDQHWEIVASRDGELVEIVQRDSDNNIEINRIVARFHDLHIALTEVSESAKSLIAFLTRGVGDDVWTDYSSVQILTGRRGEITFGTDAWKP